MQPERLSGKTPKGDAIVRPATIYEIAEIRRNDVSPRNGANRKWQAGGKARFIYLPPGLTKYAQAKFLLMDLELLTGNAEDNKAQAFERMAA